MSNSIDEHDRPKYIDWLCHAVAQLTDENASHPIMALDYAIAFCMVRIGIASSTARTWGLPFVPYGQPDRLWS